MGDATLNPIMHGSRWGVGRKLLGACLFATCAALAPACTPVVGGGVLVGVVAIAALTSHCYDYLDVSVLDGKGRKTCAATVTASNGGDHFELGSCYYAPLTDGVWTLRASLPGERDAFTTVVVEHEQDCARHVQTVELTLSSPGTPVFAVQPTPPATTSAPLLPVPSVPSVPQPVTPSVEPRAAPLDSSAVPPTETFPNQP